VLKTRWYLTCDLCDARGLAISVKCYVKQYMKTGKIILLLLGRVEEAAVVYVLIIVATPY
jgi:hypothetical protein